MLGRPLAQLYAWFVGSLLLILAFVGLLTNVSLDTGGAVQSQSALGLTFNGWYVMLYAAFGAVLIATSGRLLWVRSAALGTGIAFLLFAFLGMALDGETILAALPVSLTDSIVHLLVGAGGVVAGTAAVAMEERRGPLF